MEQFMNKVKKLELNLSIECLQLTLFFVMLANQ